MGKRTKSYGGIGTFVGLGPILVALHDADKLSAAAAHTPGVLP